MRHEIYEKEFSISEIINNAWEIFSAKLKLILFLTLMFAIPINAVLYFFPIEISEYDENFFENFETSAQIAHIIAEFIYYFSLIAIALIAKEFIDKKKASSLKEIFSNTFKIWPALIGTDILKTLLLLVLTLLLIIPGIIFGIYWIFAIFTVIFHEKFGRSALSHSKELVKGRWFNIFGFALVFIILEVLISGGSAYIFKMSLHDIMEQSIFTEISINTFTNFIRNFFFVAWLVFYINRDRESFEKKENLL